MPHPLTNVTQLGFVRTGFMASTFTGFIKDRISLFLYVVISLMDVFPNQWTLTYRFFMKTATLFWPAKKILLNPDRRELMQMWTLPHSLYWQSSKRLSFKNLFFFFHSKYDFYCILMSNSYTCIFFCNLHKLIPNWIRVHQFSLVLSKLFFQDLWSIIILNPALLFQCDKIIVCKFKDVLYMWLFSNVEIQKIQLW